MPRKLKDILITKLALVDAGDNPGARVALFKRREAMEKEEDVITKTEVLGKLEAIAKREQVKDPKLSAEQAMSAALDTEEGRAGYQEYLHARADQIEPVDDELPGTQLQQGVWMAMETLAEEQVGTELGKLLPTERVAAINKMLESPEGKELYKAFRSPEAQEPFTMQRMEKLLKI
jgi:hypothetical protein